MTTSASATTRPAGGTSRTALLLASLATAVAGLAFPNTGLAQDTPQAPPLTSVFLDVVTLTRQGDAVTDLNTEDFVVTVGGTRRRVAARRFVTRGPGAVADAQALVSGRPPGSAAAEPSRTILLLIDQTTLVRGEEQAAVSAVRETLDRLGLDDQVAVLRLPLDAGVALTFDEDRPSLVTALRKVAGQMAATSPIPTDPFASDDASRPVALNPERAGSTDRTTATEQERAAAAELRSADQPRRDGLGWRDNLSDLTVLFQALGQLPGRKAVILFSGGLTAAERSRLDDAARAAASAHVTLHAVAWRTSGLTGGHAPDVVALEALAAATGGRFATAGRSTRDAVVRILLGLSACYVLTLEGPRPLAHAAVKVAVSRKGVMVHAPAWLTSREDAGDQDPPAAAGAPVPGSVPPDAIPRVGVSYSSAPMTPRVPDAAQLALRQRVLARAADYVEAYQRAFSSLVAEEEFEQVDQTPHTFGRSQRLKSDVLLVKVDQVSGWVSFRDVYEVDGKPVRERDDRLRRLFLDPVMDPWIRLEAVQQESARYNLGPVRRTVNAPLYALAFLERQAQSRFAFWVEGTREVEGLPVWEVSYREVSVPTFARTAIGDSQPARGRFLIDQATGAVIDARIHYERSGAGAMDYDVRFRRDETLGLWMPVEMKETYTANGRALVKGVARYSNPRRFQVTTDTQVTVPK